MLLFETLLVRGGYNSGVALKWPPCSTALKYFQYPAAEWDSSCLFSALAISILFLSLPFVSFSVSLLYLSIRLSMSLPAPLRGCLFPEFIHASWWRGPHYLRWMDLRPVLPVPKVRATAWNSRCLTLLDISPLLILLFRSPASFSKDSFHDTRLTGKRLLIKSNISWYTTYTRLCHTCIVFLNILSDDADFVR